MLKRVLTGAALVIIIAALFIFSDTLIFPIVLGFCSIMGVNEMLGCIGARKNIIISACMYALALAATVLACTIHSHSLFITVYAATLFMLLLVVFGCSVFSHGAIPFEKSCIAFTTCAFVVTGFMSLVMLRDLEIGKFIFLLAFVGPWFTDTFAYFTGYFFGKHKLIPDVSPKKTIEGSVGGTLFCIIGCAIYGYIIKANFLSDIPPVWAFAILGFILAIVSQVGDLIFSLIKRKYNIKDYGFIFPGHGGVLDRFDSIIATAPLLLIFFEAYNKLF